MIVDQVRPLVELHSRGETGWRLQAFSKLDDEVPLEALNCSLPLNDIYRRIEIEEEPPTDPA